MQTQLPDHLKAFLQRIESFEGLEVVLFLAGEPDRVRTQSELPRPELQPGLSSELARAGLVVCSEQGWRLSSEATVRSCAAELRTLFRDNPLPIVQFLNQSAIERVRASAARTFADAFVVRRNDNG
jgi:hypothetical protein